MKPLDLWEENRFLMHWQYKYLSKYKGFNSSLLRFYFMQHGYNQQQQKK